MSQHPAPAVTAQVRILGSQYLVVMDGHSHVVGKDRRCHTCNDGQCTAVNEVALYLKAGGQRAPDAVPPRARAPDPLPPCPICGAPVVVDHVLDRLKHGRGWRCTEGGYAHLFLHRYGHLKAWFCGEGARRHAMFLPDEPPAVQLRLPEPKLIPFERPTSRKQAIPASHTSDTQHEQAA